MTEHQSEERIELNIPQDDLILPFQADGHRHVAETRRGPVSMGVNQVHAGHSP